VRADFKLRMDGSCAVPVPGTGAVAIKMAETQAVAIKQGLALGCSRGAVLRR
jgi:hypothetical protein